MKKLFLLLLLASFVSIFSQPNKYKIEGTISGKIIDSSSNKPVEFATISVINTKTKKVVNGGITNEKGFFKINKVKPGNYSLDISFIGYSSIKIDNVKVEKNNLNLNLGTLKIQEDSKTLSEVNVVADKEIMVNKIDKKVFNVQKDITSESASLLEMLQNIPSIDVDQDNNISLRGNSNIRVLIDGRPATLMGNDLAAILEQFPANAVESIEVISNPSAKYDAEGMAGIINIRLKKSNKNDGTSGSILLSAGTANKYNGSLRIDHRTGKFRIFGAYSYRYNDRDFTKNALRFNNLTDTSFYLKQDNAGNRIVNSHMINAGVDYDITKNTTLSYTANYNISSRDRNEDLQYQYLNSKSELTNVTLRDAIGKVNRGSFDNNILFTSRFDKPGQELTANVSFAKSYSDKENFYEENYFTANMEPIADTLFKQNDNVGFENTTYYIQSDYTHPFSKTMKLETGLKGNIEKERNTYDLNNFYNSDYVRDTSYSSDFTYNRAIYALYATLSDKIKKVSWQAGLRYEMTQTSFDIVNDNNNYLNTLHDFFPTMHLSYEVAEMSNIQLSYSRRINRPSMHSLNPIPNFSDPANVRVGNPYLKPEFVNSMELGFDKRIKSVSIVTSIYYRYITDMIRRYKKVDDSGKSIVTYTNLDNGQNYGLEFIVNASFLKTFRANASLNMYRTIINGNNDSENDLTNDAYGMSSRLMISGKLPKKFSVQFSTMYRSPITIPQGEIEAMYWSDISIKKKILKDKGSLSLRLSDIFNTRDFDIYLDDVNFTQSMHYKTTSRVLYLSFTYNFGKQLSKRYDKRKNNNNKHQRDSDDDIGL